MPAFRSTDRSIITKTAKSEDFYAFLIDRWDFLSTDKPLTINYFAVFNYCCSRIAHKMSDKFSFNYGLRYSMFNRLGSEELNTYAIDVKLAASYF